MKRSESPKREDPDHELMQKCLEALLEKDRLGYMGSFIQGLIHNINGPLQNMSMLAEFIVSGQNRLDQFAQEYCNVDHLEAWNQIYGKQEQRFQQLVGQISLVIEMVRDFMLLSELGRNETEVDLNLVINKLVHVFRADLFFKHHVKLELQLADNVPLIKILARHLILALVHLFQNAMIAMRGMSKKQLIIESRLEGDKIELVFRDSGCGFPEGKEFECFGLFNSAWPPETAIQDKQEKHFGWGLFAARILLEPYGVEVQLKREDQETLAVLEIPLKPKI